jgi:outer membrane protein TolC
MRLSIVVTSLVILCNISYAQPPGDTLRARIDGLVARPGGLGSDEVAARAVDTSFQLRQRSADVQAAAAAVDQSLVGYFPRLSVAGRYARLSDLDNDPLGTFVLAPKSGPGPLPPNALLVNVPATISPILNSTSLSATLTVPLLDYVLRIPSVHAAAKRSRDAAAWSERAARLQIAADARVAYYGWARARLQAVVAEQALLQAREHLDNARHAFEAGTASKADVLRVEAQVAASELFVARAHDYEAVLEDQLRTAMHDDAGRAYQIGEDLRAVLPVTATPAIRDLTAEAWSSRLELRVVEASLRAQRAQIEVARAGALPRLDAFGDVVYANPNQRFFPQRDTFDMTWDVGVQLSWSPNETASSLEAVRGARAKAEAIEAQRCALRDAVRGEVVQATEALREADLAVRSTARGLDAAEESYRVRRELFVNGRATSVELTDAETDLTQARLAAVGAAIDQRVARIRFLHATGRDVAPAERS